MNQSSLTDLIKHGLSAMKSGTAVAEKATAEIMNDATNSELKEQLQEGSQTAQQWKSRVARAIGDVGSVEEHDNEILEAHYEASQIIRDNAEDDYARDLGIIASGQLALHYWIAAFGTMRTYADNEGHEQTSRDMQTCLDEAKRADEMHTKLAVRILNSGQRTERAA